MEKILITGAMGQLGSELTTVLREHYGQDNVIGTDIRRPDEGSPLLAGPYELLDVLDGQRMAEIVKNEKVDTIIHLAAVHHAPSRRSRPVLAQAANRSSTVPR